MSCSQVYPALVPSAADPIVLLHGWGFDRASMAPLVEPLRQLADVWCVNLPGFGAEPPLAQSGLEALTDFLAEQLPPRACLIGWSLGGVLALAYAHRFSARVSAVVSLACNAKFVATEDWPCAMARDVNRRFNRSFVADPAATLKRFCGLVAQGSPDARARVRSLRALLQSPADRQLGAWEEGLALLSQSDLRAVLSQIDVPCLHLLADGDALVPAAASTAISGLNPRHQVELIQAAGHALHWDQPGRVAEVLTTFLRPAGSGLLDKRWVAKSFSRAAASYDSAARLQRQVGSKLLARLPPVSGVLVDLGSGTGHFLSELKRANPDAELIALDIAEGMLQHSRRQGCPAEGWVCADAEALPLAEASVAACYSSLAIQWCEDYGRLFAELERSLRPGGIVCLSTLTEGTLAELRRAWQAVDGYVHVNRFVAMAQVRRALEEAGFVDIDICEETVVLHCADLRALSAELKALGAHNVNTGRPRGLTGRQRLARLEAVYEAERTPAGVPASYQVCYISAKKAL